MTRLAELGMALANHKAWPIIWSIGAPESAPIFCAALKTGSSATNLAASNAKPFLVMSDWSDMTKS
jgi:hypothetical protein